MLLAQLWSGFKEGSLMVAGDGRGMGGGASFLRPVFWTTHPISSKDKTCEDVRHHTKDTHCGEAVALAMIWSITISSILTDFSPQCKDCTCSDTRTRCSSQNSFHSYSFQELVNCNFTRETKHETPLRELFTGKSLSAESSGRFE